jgi:hypothetical protein
MDEANMSEKRLLWALNGFSFRVSRAHGGFSIQFGDELPLFVTPPDEIVLRVRVDGVEMVMTEGFDVAKKLAELTERHAKLVDPIWTKPSTS